jgi:hypothetical protein
LALYFDPRFIELMKQGVNGNAHGFELAFEKILGLHSLDLINERYLESDAQRKHIDIIT